MFRRIHVYDLDGVLVDSSHRVKRCNDGSIDCQYWLNSFTPENIKLDKLLPHIWQYVDAIINPYTYVILCSVRNPTPLNLNFVRSHLGQPNKLLLVGESYPPFKPAYVLKRNALQPIFNLRQFQNLPRTLWEDNQINIDRLGDLFTHTILVKSNQGA
jgi:hypothetical protein